MARPKSELTKFVLSLPATLSVPEVITRAKAAGFKVSPGNVYRVRRMHGPAGGAAAPTKGEAKPAAAAPAARGGARRRRRRKRGGRAAAPAHAGPSVAPKATIAPAEVTFRKLVLELGVPRARTLLGEVERGLAALLRGE